MIQLNFIFFGFNLKRILLSFALVFAFLSNLGVAEAAFNDVILTNSIVTVAGFNLSLTGTIQRLVTRTNDFDVVLAPGSSLSVTSLDRKDFGVSVVGVATHTEACNSTSSTLTFTSPASVSTTTVSIVGNCVGASVPAQVTGLAGIDGSTQSILSWTAPSNGGSAITDYIVEYKLLAAPTYSIFNDGVSTVTGTTLTGLTNGSSYRVRVSAVNAIGIGASSSIIAVNPVAAATVPGAPQNVSGSAGNAEVSVSFNSPVSNGGSAITSYTVTASPGGRTATGASSPITVTSLTNGTAYTFTVTATNGVGTGASSAASTAVTPSAAVTVPGAPQNVTATAGDGQVVVSFNAPASTGGSSITGYTVTASPGGQTASAVSSPITVTSLTNGTSYTFTAVAINAVGAGASSAASAAVTPTATVTSGGGGSSGGGGGGGGGKKKKKVTATTTVPTVPVVSPTTPVTNIPVVPVILFVRNLVIGDSGDDVRQLQKFLNSHGAVISATGDGSIGFETTLFGPGTQKALAKFQCANNIVCSGSPSTTGYGAMGPTTRAAINTILQREGASSGGGGTPVARPCGVPSGTTSGASLLLRNLAIGSTGEDVRQLQKFLNSHGAVISTTGGDGSIGMETTLFGLGTQKALAKFQCLNNIVCSGDANSTGYGAMGPTTRNIINALILKESPAGVGAVIPCPTPVPVVTTAPVVLPTTSGKTLFTRNLIIGDEGEDVRRLQKFLNSHGAVISTTGDGSIGMETTLFGLGTQKALAKFQCLNNIICSGDAYSTGYGAMGPTTRNSINAILLRE